MPKTRYHDIQPINKEPLVVPDSNELLDHEIEFLERIAKIGSWPTKLADWKGIAIKASRDARNNRKMDIHLRFRALDPHSHAKNSDPGYLIEIGSYISTGEHPCISYCFAIGIENEDGPFSGLRKLHIDYEYNTDTNEPKPIIHLQTPGRIWPALLRVGYETTSFAHLNPKLDKPRIPCLPVSIAIIAHIALLEYVSVDSQIGTFIKTPEWLLSIAASEKFILERFFQCSLNWMQKSQNESNSIISYFYRYE